ncbi:TPA: class I SAM-dependent methyltransferase, partial [Campylobacter jejuni]|nr:class I SAM-dependent methyltransferase [Campylobacter jejuni]
MDLVRWFFKNNLDKLQNAKVLEFASHNGNNLSLFA